MFASMFVSMLVECFDEIVLDRVIIEKNVKSLM